MSDPYGCGLCRRVNNLSSKIEKEYTEPIYVAQAQRGLSAIRTVRQNLVGRLKKGSHRRFPFGLSEGRWFDDTRFLNATIWNM